MTDGKGTQLHLPGMESAPSEATEGRGASIQVPAHPLPGQQAPTGPVILRYVPARPEQLVEPFVDLAALSIAAAARGCADAFRLNDAHAPPWRLWQEILYRPEQLAARYARRWHAQLGRERTCYDQIRHRFNAEYDPADFLYLLARCVKAAIRHNARGEFNNTPDHRRRGARPAAPGEDRAPAGTADRPDHWGLHLGAGGLYAPRPGLHGSPVPGCVRTAGFPLPAAVPP